MAYSFISHTADLKIKATGKTLTDVFKSSSMALREAMTDKLKIHPRIQKVIDVKGCDIQALLYSFLEEFLFLLDAESFVFDRVLSLEIKEEGEGFTLHSTVSGDLASRYDITNNVKAITYNEMTINKEGNQYVATFVLDV